MDIRRAFRQVVGESSMLLLGFCAVPLCSAEAVVSGAAVTPAAHHDVSPPMSGMASWRQAPGAHIKPLHLLPGSGNAALQADAALQTQIGFSLGTSELLNLLGIGAHLPGFSVNAIPSDSNGAVGATQFVEWVNESFAVFSKTTGGLIYGPVAGNVLWSGFGGLCETDNDGDPVVQYDKVAGRWIMTQFAVTGGPPYYQCVAVSTTSDATGSYNRYAFAYNAFPDYPKLGVWPDAYYVTFNMFTPPSFTFQGSQVCAYNRSQMLSGGAATQQCFQLSSNYGGLLPSDQDGLTAPPAGSPAFMVSFGANALNLWKFHVDWTTPANTTLTGPATIPVAAFTPACNGGSCIPQAGTSQKLDSLADRLMYRLAYRNFQSHESMVVNHSVAVGTSKRNAYSGVRWYELRSPSGGTMAGGVPVVYQQGTYAPDSSYRWMGSIAMDKMGDIVVGYSVSSSVMNPSVRYTGRAPSDPLGTLRSENTVIGGTGSQTQYNRWGDYTSMSVDPADDCTFWYTDQYLQSSGVFNWDTRILSFKFPGCL